MERSKMMHYFFIGTEAELIKMASVIELFRKNRLHFKIISSGQNDITHSTILKHLGIPAVDIKMAARPVVQKPWGLVSWFIATLLKGCFFLGKEFRGHDKKRTWFIIHGDTVTTMVGAMIGRYHRLKVAHVEAGYQSRNFLKPFPEELDRTVASALSDILFCPYDSIGKEKLHKVAGKDINIHYNTSIDSLELALRKKVPSALANRLKNKRYFIFALHRQETLLNRKLVIKLIDYLLNMETGMICVFALHHPTSRLLKDLGLFEKVQKSPKIVLTPRLQYFEYIRILDMSEFIMTDGVGNQQETYYMGKPCLIMRQTTEGCEGLNKNAVLSHNNMGIIGKFVKDYRKFKRKPVRNLYHPSKIIFEYFHRMNQKEGAGTK